MARRHAYWTVPELRRLKEMHAVGLYPSCKDVVAAFPRHPSASVLNMARRLRLRRPRGGPMETDVLRWLGIVHQHFSRREAGLLA